MPIYEYRCEDCGVTFDMFVRSISAPITVECPQCHSRHCKKHFSTFGMVGSGSGPLGATSCAPGGG